MWLRSGNIKGLVVPETVGYTFSAAPKSDWDTGWDFRSSQPVLSVLLLLFREGYAAS